MLPSSVEQRLGLWAGLGCGFGARNGSWYTDPVVAEHCTWTRLPLPVSPDSTRRHATEVCTEAR
jgi:hypothetical protein